MTSQKQLNLNVLPQNLSPIYLAVDLNFFVKPRSRKSRDIKPDKVTGMRREAGVEGEWEMNFLN